MKYRPPFWAEQALPTTKFAVVRTLFAQSSLARSVVKQHADSIRRAKQRKIAVQSASFLSPG